MTTTRRTRIQQYAIAFVLLISTAAHAQIFNLNDLAKSLTRQTNLSDINGLIKSFTDIVQGQVMPGAHVPEDVDGKVVLYSTAWCGYCKSAVAYMKEKNIPYVERNIEYDPKYKAEYTQLGGKGVPFILFGRKTLSGFSSSAFDQNYAEFQRTFPTSPNQTAQNQAVLPQPTSTKSASTQLTTQQTPQRNPQSADTLQAGDTMIGKISGIRVFKQPNKSADKLLVMNKTDEVIYMGEEKNGLYRVTTAQGEGWVDKLLIKKN